MRRFESLAGLTRIVQIGIGVSLAIELVAAILEVKLLGLISALEAGTVGTVEADAHDALALVVLGAAVAVFIVVAILFLIWGNRANRNLDSLGISRKDFSPGWAVGWWFVPIANLVKPFEIMSEIWRGSFTRSASARKGSARVPIAMRVWWGAWIFGGIISRISTFTVRGEAPTYDDFRLSSYLTLVSSVLMFIAGIVAINLIGAISTAQEAKSRAPAPSEPPSEPVGGQ